MIFLSTNYALQLSIIVTMLMVPIIFFSIATNFMVYQMNFLVYQMNVLVNMVWQ